MPIMSKNERSCRVGNIILFEKEPFIGLLLKDDDNCLIMAILQFESLGMTEFRFDSIHQKTVFENEPISNEDSEVDKDTLQG